MKKLDLVGKRFVRLLVLEEAKERKNGKVVYLCECDCGKIFPVVGSKLISGESKSCGCYSHDKIGRFTQKAEGQASFNYVYRSYKNSAKRRNLDFELSEIEFRNVTSQNCHYCGKEPKQYYKRTDTNGKYIYNGIDRVDNSKGYIKNNVVPCCQRCNRMKTDMSYDEFIHHMKTILTHLNEI